jgi:diguanylate cyclase (GGDEF)-like protein
MDKDRIRVLLVDDDEDDYIMTRDLLDDVRERDYTIEWVPRFEDAVDKIANEQYDIYLFDYRLGEKTGIDLLRYALESGCKAPIILLTGQGDSEIDIEAMKAGAADYLPKNEINSGMLDRSIRYAIQHKRSEERIRRMAYYDPLTNLPNRSLFHDRLRQAVAHGERHSLNMAVLFLDLDNFKRVNDTLEHRIGDLLLQEVAERLSGCLRSSDTVSRQSAETASSTVARLGGDEFTILLPEIDSMDCVARVARRILNVVAKPFRLEGHEVFVTGSIGIAVFPDDGRDMDTLLKNADTAMYHAKEHGKNNFQFYKRSMNASAFERMTLENDLRKAIEQDEFMLYYQPRLDLPTGKICAMEALIRWNNPERGVVSPADFIPLAEESGLIIPIGEWVLRSACRQLNIWQRNEAPEMLVAVSMNISGKQFRQESLVQTIERILQDYDIEPDKLEVEITESVMMKNAELTMTTLERLKEMGVRLSMDDFGTGYSSFNYLKRFPLDVIKIDKSFVKDVNNNEEDAAIVRAIIAMARSLKLRVIAEGVETPDQLRFLQENGCDEIQGYLLSPPVPADEVIPLIRRVRDGSFLKEKVQIR